MARYRVYGTVTLIVSGEVEASGIEEANEVATRRWPGMPGYWSDRVALAGEVLAEDEKADAPGVVPGSLLVQGHEGLVMWGEVAGPEEIDPPPPAHPVHEAARKLWDQFFARCPGVHPYVQSIGVAETAGTIHVYLVREPMPHERPIPGEVDGWKVETRVIGRVAVGPPND